MAAEVPGAQEVIFRTRSVDGWQLLAVNKKHVVAFPPPFVLILKNGHRHANKVAPTGCFHPDIITFSVWILFPIHVTVRFPLVRRSLRRSSLTILRMKIKLIRREGFRVSPIVNVEIESIRLDRALVRDR